MSAPIETVLRRLEDRDCPARQTGPGRWMARCPSHEDRSPSLSLRNTAGRDGELVLVHCFAGCETPDVLSALDLDLADLYELDRPRTRRPAGRTLPPVVRGPLRAAAGDRPLDRLLTVLGAAGLDYRADAIVDHLWHAECPVCRERLSLLVEEAANGRVRMSCRTSCDTDRIERQLEQAVRRAGGWAR